MDEEVCADAIRLALAHDRPVYDCVYLALAQRIGALLVTADRRFVYAMARTPCSKSGGPVEPDVQRQCCWS